MNTRGGVASVIIVMPPDEDCVYGGTVQLVKGMSCAAAAPETKNANRRSSTGFFRSVALI
jgi:hypothetical protein